MLGALDVVTPVRSSHSAKYCISCPCPLELPAQSSCVYSILSREKNRHFHRRINLVIQHINCLRSISPSQFIYSFFFWKLVGVKIICVNFSIPRGAFLCEIFGRLFFGSRNHPEKHTNDGKNLLGRKLDFWKINN